MKREQGSSLVEMTLVLPLLLLIFLGLIEVGYAIRGEMILFHLTAETARFGIKPRILDPYAPEMNYSAVWAHFDDIQESANPDMNQGNYRIYIHFFELGVGRPCIERPCFGPCQLVPVELIDDSDEYFKSPLERPSWEASQGELDVESRIDYQSLQDKLLRDEFLTQCRKEQRDEDDWLPTIHRVLIVEMIYYQPQLLGFPFFQIVDPIPLYATDTIRWSGK